MVVVFAGRLPEVAEEVLSLFVSLCCIGVLSDTVSACL